MNRYVWVVIALCLLALPVLITSAPIDNTLNFHLFFDAWAIDALWAPHVGLRTGIGATLTSGIGFELPLFFLIDRTGGGEALLDIALKLTCYPWQKGPFISLSLAQVALFIGPFVPQESIHYLNEIGIGYTWEFIPDWYIEPAILYRDPSHTFPESFTYIADYIPGYKKFQIFLKFGWIFASISPSMMTK